MTARVSDHRPLFVHPILSLPSCRADSWATNAVPFPVGEGSLMWYSKGRRSSGAAAPGPSEDVPGGPENQMTTRLAPMATDIQRT